MNVLNGFCFGDPHLMVQTLVVLGIPGLPLQVLPSKGCFALGNSNLLIYNTCKLLNRLCTEYY